MNKIEYYPFEGVSQIFPGATQQIYKRVDEDTEISNALLLRGKELSSLGELNVAEMERVSADVANSRVQRYLLQRGDVVLLARGSAIRAGYVSAEVAKNKIIASANFILIRPDHDKVLGEVIAAYINSPQGRKALLKLSVGTAVQQVPASELRRFSLPVPSIEKQRIVAELYRAGISAYRETIALADQQQITANVAIAILLQETD